MNWDDLSPTPPQAANLKWDDLQAQPPAPSYGELAKSKAVEGLGNIGDMREWALSHLPQGLQSYARTGLQSIPIVKDAIGRTPTSQQLRDLAGIKEVQPQGLGQEAFGGTVSALANPISFAGLGGPAFKALSAAAGGAGSALGGEAGENIAGTPGRIGGSLIGGLAGGGVAAGALAPKVAAGPSLREVKQNASNTYDALTAVNNVQHVPTADLNTLADDIQTVLNRRGARPSVAPAIHAAVNEIRTPATANAGDVTDLVAARQTVKGLLGAKGSDKAGAVMAMPMIDAEIERRSPGTMAELKKADNDWAIVRANEALDKKLARAELRAAGEGSGMNLGNKIGQKVTDYLVSEESRFLSPQNRALLEPVARHTIPQKIMRFGSNALGGGGGIGMTGLGLLGAGVAGEYTGHPELAALPLAGLGLRMGYNRSVANQAANAAAKMRQNSMLTPSTPTLGMSPLQSQLLRSAVLGLTSGR